MMCFFSIRRSLDQETERELGRKNLSLPTRSSETNVNLLGLTLIEESTKKVIRLLSISESGKSFEGRMAISSCSIKMINKVEPVEILLTAPKRPHFLKGRVGKKDALDTLHLNRLLLRESIILQNGYSRADLAARKWSLTLDQNFEGSLLQGPENQMLHINRIVFCDELSLDLIFSFIKNKKTKRTKIRKSKFLSFLLRSIHKQPEESGF